MSHVIDGGNGIAMVVSGPMTKESLKPYSKGSITKLTGKVQILAQCGKYEFTDVEGVSEALTGWVEFDGDNTRPIYNTEMDAGNAQKWLKKNKNKFLAIWAVTAKGQHYQIGRPTDAFNNFVAWSSYYIQTQMQSAGKIGGAKV